MSVLIVELQPSYNAAECTTFFFYHKILHSIKQQKNFFEQIYGKTNQHNNPKHVILSRFTASDDTMFVQLKNYCQF